MITGLRGLAQAFVRGAVAIGRGIEATYTALTDLGLGYVKSQFEMDWQTYDEQTGLVDYVKDLPRDQLIPGVAHGESTWQLTSKFKYDVKTVYEDVRGNTKTFNWSVISDMRLTQDEISEQADVFRKDYAPTDFPFSAQAEIVGLWHRAAVEGL